MMQVKKGGKYVEGHEPETIAGVKYSTFRARLDREKLRGEHDGPAHQAQRQAEEIARQARGEEPVEAETKAVTVQMDAKPPVPPVTPTAPVQPLSGPERHATINITLKSRIEQHRHLKLMSVYTGRSVQDLVSCAVDEFISRNPIVAP